MNTEQAFRTYRPLLFSIAYNMLGSVMDAEDCVQETFLRWHRAYSSGEAEAIRSPRSYLCTIVTHLSIDQLRAARNQRESYDGVWLPEPVLLSDPGEYVEAAEILSVAFLRLLETLAPIERAVFLLRQVFDYDYAEIARIVGKNEANCRQIAHRARRHLAAQSPRYTVTSEQQAQLFERFMQASSDGNVEELLRLLTRDVVLYSDGGENREPVVGAQAVVQALLKTAQRVAQDTAWHWAMAAINGRPGMLVYAYSKLYAVIAFELLDQRVQEIDIIVNPDKLRHIHA